MGSMVPTLETLQAIAPEIVAVERSMTQATTTIRIEVAPAKKHLVPGNTVPPTNRLIDVPAVYMNHVLTDLVLASMQGTAGLIDYIRRVVDHAKDVYRASQRPPFESGDFVTGRAGEAARLQAESRIRYASHVSQDKPPPGRPLIDVLFEDEAPIGEPAPPTPPPDRFADDDSAFQARLLRKQLQKSKESKS